MKTLLGFVEGVEHVCCRYRFQAFAPHLGARGWRLEARALPRSGLGRLRLLRGAHHADGVLLQRKLLHSLELKWLRHHSGQLLFDFDDAIFQRDSFARKQGPCRRRLRRFRQALLAADRIIAGNDYLASRAREFVEPHRVVMIPTCIEPGDYPLGERRAPKSRGAGLELVWIGSASAASALERASSLLEHVGRCIPGLRLKVISSRFPRFERLPVEAVPWSSATEAAALAAGDVGISLLPDDGWSRGKCGLKVLQYMCAGLPVVANPVGVQAGMVEDGRSGFLAASPDEWVQALRTLASDRQRAWAMGRRGRQIVEERYSVRAWADAFEAVLNGQPATR